MKAAVIAKPGTVPAYGDFEEPVAQPGQEIIAVKAAALTHLTKSRASGEHYSSEHVYPAIAGVDGVGQTAGGRRVYFALPVPPFGAMAEKAPMRASQCVPVPDNLDDVSAAALGNPGRSCWAAFAARAQLKRGETVLVNGATGAAGRLAVQIAKYMGAGRVIAAGQRPRSTRKPKIHRRRRHHSLRSDCWPSRIRAGVGSSARAGVFRRRGCGDRLLVGP